MDARLIEAIGERIERHAKCRIDAIEVLPALGFGGRDLVVERLGADDPRFRRSASIPRLKVDADPVAGFSFLLAKVEGFDAAQDRFGGISIVDRAADFAVTVNRKDEIE